MARLKENWKRRDWLISWRREHKWWKREDKQNLKSSISVTPQERNNFLYQAID